VDRKGESRGIRSIEKASRLMRGGDNSFLIYPEGTRSRDGKLQRFRRAVLPGHCGGAPIVPVTIKGTFELMPKGQFGSKRGTVSVEFHPPVSVEGYSVQNMDGLIRTGQGRRELRAVKGTKRPGPRRSVSGGPKSGPCAAWVRAGGGGLFTTTSYCIFQSIESKYRFPPSHSTSPRWEIDGLGTRIYFCREEIIGKSCH